MQVTVTVRWRRLPLLRRFLILLVRLRLMSAERAIRVYGAAMWRTARAYLGSRRIDLGPFPGFGPMSVMKPPDPDPRPL